jgi:hypothetical protein
MATLTFSQVYNLARDAGLNPAAAVTATAIAKAESGLRTDAVGDVGLQDSKWGPSIGLWQVRSVKAESGKGTSRDGTRLADPAFNARSMVEISGGGTNWRPWSVFLHGSYRQFVDQAAAAAGQPAPPVTGSASDFAGVSTGGAAEAKPDGWVAEASANVQEIGLKLTATLAAVALVVVGVMGAVNGKASQ